jgi:callose synthase
MLLTNECQKGEHVNPLIPPARLHDKMFSNYVKWCTHLDVAPQFSPIESGRSYLAKIEDMLVFLLVWGESANLKHMPECLCYLYHKTMQDHLSLVAKKHYAAKNVNFYPGYFLDMVVTPIYDVVAASMKCKMNLNISHSLLTPFFPHCSKRRSRNTQDI